MLTDEQGQPQSGPDSRVDIIYRPGGKPYRAAVKNLEDSPGAAPLSDEQLSVLAPPAPAGEKSAEGPKKPARSAPDQGDPQEPQKMPGVEGVIHVYTDGACTGNPGPMGIGVVILDTSPESTGRRELSLYLGMGTNNIAELTAIQRGLADLPRDRPVIIYSDSAYSIGVLSLGWRAKANQELIANMRRQLGEFKRVSFIKVAGHAGIPENERCDELARQAIARRQS